MIGLKKVANNKYSFLKKGISFTAEILLLSLSFFISCSNNDPILPTNNERDPQTITADFEGETYQGPVPEFTKVNVFNTGLLLSGYNNFRIPALVTTNDGTLLAFSEMRTGGDHDPKTLVYRRSTDNGDSWGPVTLVEELTHSNVYGNENLVVDQNTGTIHLVYIQLFPGSNGNTCNVYHKTSIDDGLTWSERELVPNVVNAAWRPVGPAAGIQLQRGENKGRLLIPGRYSESGSQGNYCMYSDDNGVSWNLGYKSQRTEVGLENEPTAMELSSQDETESVIYINSRDQAANNNLYRRLDAYSYDSGESLVGAFQRNDYIKTVKVQGNLFRWSATDQGDSKDRILFSAPSFAKENLSGGPVRNKRRHVGIWSTFDETKTWTPVAKRISDLSGSYSSMVKTTDGYLGILFEEGKSVAWDEATFVKINEAFLDVPLVGSKWSFEEVGPVEEVSEGEELEETYNGGTSRNITAYGNITTTEGSAEFKQNTALKFDGNSYLKLNDLDTWTQFDFNENSSFTLEMVIRVNDSNETGFLVGRPYQAMWPQWLIRMESDGKLSFRVDDDESFTFVESKESLADGEWYHIAVVRDRSSHKLKIYIDGELSNEVFDEVEGSLTNRKPLYIGGTDDGNDDFVGAIDFVRITPYVIENFFE